jgi:hypothetical protein
MQSTAKSKMAPENFGDVEKRRREECESKQQDVAVQLARQFVTLFKNSRIFWAL